MIASALGVRFDLAVTGEDLMPDAFGLSMNKTPYPQFNPLHFDFEPSGNGNNGNQ